MSGNIYNDINNAMYDLTKVKLEMKFKEYCKIKGIKQYVPGADDNSYTYNIAVYGDNSTKSKCTIYNGNKHPQCNDTTLMIAFDESKQTKRLVFESDGKVVLITDNRDDGKVLYQEDKVVKMIYDHKEFFDSINVFVEA